MALGGYCPGTSVVGIMTGRLDGLIFAFGMVAGIWFFSAVYDSAWLHAILTAGRIDARTLPDLLGVSPWLVLLAMSVAAGAGFLIGGRHERRTQAG